MHNETDANRALFDSTQQMTSAELHRALSPPKVKVMSGYTWGDAMADLLFIVGMLGLIWGLMTAAEFIATWMNTWAQ